MRGDSKNPSSESHTPSRESHTPSRESHKLSPDESLPTERDQLFRSTTAPEEFRFDEAVARVFPDMLRRSIPGYQALLHMIGVLAAQVVQDETRVYDLGCSLGAATLAVRHALGSRRARLIALDTSSAMIERCQAALEADSASCPVDARVGNLVEEHVEDASLVILNFTLQFVEREERGKVLRRIAEGLRPGGVVVVSEKTQATAETDEALLTSLHDAFRRSNGYSQLELSRKRESLERVLIPEAPEAHRARLESAGLEVTEWFRCLNFVSWVGRKP